MTVFRACIKLDVPEEALKMASDPVRYGLFPKSNATHELLMAFVRKDDFKGGCGEGWRDVLTYLGVWCVLQVQQKQWSC